MTPKQILLDAADLLETKGWTQGAYARHRQGWPMLGYIHIESKEDIGCLCALGAISMAQGFDPWDNAGFWAAKSLLPFIDERQTSTWNDAEGQTAENVIKTMREAAHEA